jgi:hypothetical protein
MMDKYLKRIAKLLTEINNPVELDNIQRDLEMLCLRIESHEYCNTDFLNRQDFDTQRRTYEFFNYLLGYYHHSITWATVLKKIPLADLEVIFDFCPGGTPKIQWALRHLNYHKRLYIFDKDQVACEQVNLLLNILNVAYDFSFVQQDIFEPYSLSADLITANHIFDDLALDNYSKLKNIELRLVYSSEKLFRKVIQDIPHTLDTEAFCNRLFQTVDDKLKQNGYLIMSHYLGLTERALNFLEWSNWILKLMENLYDMFINRGYYPYIPLTNKILPNTDKSFFILQKR